jgi:hypothetical protein
MTTMMDEPSIEEVWAMADIIKDAVVSTPNGPRTVGYYLSVGLDHFNHPHDRYQELLNAAAAAALRANTANQCRDIP